MVEILTNGTRQWCEAAFTVEKDIDKLGDAMMARIEEKSVPWASNNSET